MKIIQSFWPRTTDKEKLKYQIKFYELSSYLLKSTFEKKYEVHLVTNNLGAEILKDINYYDNINLYFNNPIFKEVDDSLWSFHKIMSLKAYEEPAVHFDADFFIGDKNDILEKVESPYQVIVQSKEFGAAFKSNYGHQLHLYNKIYNIHNDLINFVYNCGVIGFRDLFIRNIFINEFIFKISNSLPKLDILKEEALKYFSETDINCLFEQYTLAEVAFAKNVFVRELVDCSHFIHKGMISGHSPINNFFHACGPGKYSKAFYELLDNVYRRLLQNPTLNACDLFRLEKESGAYTFLSPQVKNYSDFYQKMKSHGMTLNTQ